MPHNRCAPPGRSSPPRGGSPSRPSPAPWARPSWIWPRPNSWASRLRVPGQPGGRGRGRGAHVLQPDPHTQVIALYLEGVKRASYFLDALTGGGKTPGHPQGRPHQAGEPGRGVPHQIHGRGRRHLRRPVSASTGSTGPTPWRNSSTLPRPWPISPAQGPQSHDHHLFRRRGDSGHRRGRESGAWRPPSPTPS